MMVDRISMDMVRERKRMVAKVIGILWVYFDNSSQGCQAYVAWDSYTWITYPFVDRKGEKI